MPTLLSKDMQQEVYIQLSPTITEELKGLSHLEMGTKAGFKREPELA